MKKNFILILAVAIFSMTACFEDPGTDILYSAEFLEVEAGTTVNGSKTYTYLRENDGQGIPAGFRVLLAAAHKSNDVNFTFAIDPASTAIENLHYTVSGTTGSIAANTSSADLPITILDDNIGAGESYTIIIDITNSDVPTNPNYTRGTHVIGVSCPSDLAGTYSYTLTENFTGTDLSGTGEISAFGTAAGEYVFDDFSFGSWEAAYGIAPPAGTLKFLDLCKKISFDGMDNYMDTWNIIEIVSSGGPELIFKYDNTYGEFGTVSLTRDDGANWPSFIL